MKKNDRLEKKVRECLTEFGVRSVLVALSGGGDSVSLLYALSHCMPSESVYACHVNHGIRGQEAERDELFCSRLCQTLGIPFSACHINVPALAKAEGCGIEECARKHRYEALGKKARELGVDAIATAHNANDRAEGVIFNLCRGSGLRGISGIPKTRTHGKVRIIRPLLEVSKDEILAYLDTLGADYVTDSTNLCTDYTRNYIRSEIMPHLSKVNSGYLDNIRSCCEILAQADDCLTRQAEEILNAQRRIGDTLYVDIAALRSLHPALRSYVIGMAYSEITSQRLSHSLICDVLALAEQSEAGGRIELPFSCNVFNCSSHLAFLPERSREKYDVRLNVGLNSFDGYGFGIYLSEVITGNFDEHCENIYSSFKCTILNADMIKSDVFARSRRENDRYSVNATNRKIKNLLNSKGITHDRRPYYPIIYNESGILCMPGFPCADTFDGRGSAKKLLVAYIPLNKTDKEVLRLEKS